jgi:hypothetical protein
MTPPRQILPGQNFEVCVRTHRRELALLATTEVRDLFLYVLAVAAKRYAITLHTLCILFSHFHLGGCDNEGRLPEFMTYVDSLIARALNCRYGRDDKFWSADGYHLLRPQTPDDLVERAVYVMCNAAAAGLVDRLEDYPGLVIGPRDIGRTITVRRPKFFFREDGKMPEQATVRFEVPTEFGDLGRDGYAKLLERRVREREREHRAERKAEGRSVMGATRLRQVRPDDRAKSWEKWFEIRPTIAAKAKRVRIDAIRALQAFRSAYREAWERFAAGDRDVEFPAGTWWVVRYASARAAPD